MSLLLIVGVFALGAVCFIFIRNQQESVVDTSVNRGFSDQSNYLVTKNIYAQREASRLIKKKFPYNYSSWELSKDVPYGTTVGALLDTTLPVDIYMTDGSVVGAWIGLKDEVLRYVKPDVDYDRPKKDPDEPNGKPEEPSVSMARSLFESKRADLVSKIEAIDYDNPTVLPADYFPENLFDEIKEFVFDELNVELVRQEDGILIIPFN